MNKYLILYYSQTGNSKFFAEKTARELHADIKFIKPIINSVPFLVGLSVLKGGIKTNISTKELAAYDEVIIWGPIWAGTLVAPLRNAIKKCVSASKNIHFAVTCEIREEGKNQRFGYINVLNEAKKVGGMFMQTTEVFSLAILENEEEWSPKLSEKPKITEADFNTLFIPKFYDFINKINAFSRNTTIGLEEASMYNVPYAFYI